MRSNYLLALLSAFLLWLAWPPIPYTAVLLLVAFVPLLIAIEQTIRGDYKNKGRKVFTLAFLTGVVWNTASIYWVYNAMNAFLDAIPSLLISLVPYTLAPLLMALAFRLYYQLRKRNGILISFMGLISFWIIYEYLHQTWDLSFPWMTLGNGFANTHQLIQWYSITGVYGGTLWIWLTNICLFLLIWQKRNGIEAINNKVLIGSLAGIICIPAIVSIVWYSKYEEHVNPSEIVTVQPNIDPFGKWGPITPEEQLSVLTNLSQKVAKLNTEFFIWPETAISDRNGVNEEEFRDYPQYQKILTFLEPYHNGNVLSGIESYALYSDQRTPTAKKIGNLFCDRFNAGVLIDGSSKLQFYHKSKLVPGAELLPFGNTLSFLKPFFAHFGGTTGGYASQDKPSVFYSASGIGAAPVICYESIWGNYVAEYVKMGAQFIAVITNDGWWGDTSGKDQHLQYAKLRAIENRRWVVRSANTGISAFINQRGDIVQKSSWWVPTALSQEINLNEELTFYTRSGDLIVYLSFLTGLISIGLMIVRKRN
ncbi:apolipoprotein N-acyltransferase [Sphingobacterium sp. DK4209]|uniref:Apolipoprotein N-acyltransferase n=1 Tax=Sphingobacterium zhuxiongii TaxID=2662364 RepID=A0A5Q0QDD9_9SPHI|nr:MULTISPECIES: apolipoprotein N-acyltransferase [unclassified Sphingobacterium]MVZ66437.1 apolipoprotein N-acyltransferase [Sphingobacterium sp. DK4209]QGA27284.1 apolipoprotein N-acyltransferase [Sphingobacterium sp. dk4302]